MASPMLVNPLLAADVGAVARPAVMPLPVPGPINAGVQPPQVHPDFAPQPVPEEERISVRVPVPKADFPEKHHKHLHDAVMGEHFDDPGAASAIRDMYAIVRKSRPHLHPRHVLEAARDAWHAIYHGFMPPEMAGAAVGNEAHRRHVEAGGKHPSDDES